MPVRSASGGWTRAGVELAPRRIVSSRLSQLVMGAATLDGFLAGASLDRALIQLPAFRRVGVRPWAAFSRKADLGDRAFLWYPTLAISGTALSVAAALAGRSEKASSAASAWLCAAAIL